MNTTIIYETKHIIAEMFKVINHSNTQIVVLIKSKMHFEYDGYLSCIDEEKAILKYSFNLDADEQSIYLSFGDIGSSTGRYDQWQLGMQIKDINGIFKIALFDEFEFNKYRDIYREELITHHLYDAGNDTLRIPFNDKLQSNDLKTIMSEHIALYRNSNEMQIFIDELDECFEKMIKSIELTNIQIEKVKNDFIDLDLDSL